MDITFPYYINFFGIPIHPHTLFEYLAIFVGYRVYKITRKRPEIKEKNEVGIFFSVMLGGYFGAIILASFEHYDLVLESIKAGNIAIIQGKTIVGALVGGLISVELYKKRIGYTKSTGDDIAIPITIALIIGRVGCFLTGIEDSTVGRATNSPFGIDFGDGIYRHPLQLYEIAFLSVVLVILLSLRKKEVWNGFKFQLFMFLYLGFRFFIEFLKDRAIIGFGLSAIQIACALGLVYYGQLMYRKYRLMNKKIAVDDGYEESDCRIDNTNEN